MRIHFLPLATRFAALLAAAFFLAAWLLPNHYPPWVGFHNEAGMFAALLLLGLPAAFSPPVLRTPLPLAGFFSVLLLTLALQCWAGLIPYAGDALVSGLYLGACFGAWMLGARARLQPRPGPFQAEDWMAALFLAAALVSTWMVALQWLRPDDELMWLVAQRGSNRLYANLGQPNNLASLLVMATLGAYFLRQRGFLQRWQLALVVVFLSFATVACESRAGLLSALCVGLFVLAPPATRRPPGVWRFVALWWLLLGMYMALWRPLNAAIDMGAVRTTEAASTHERLQIWQQMLAAIERAPWFGYGWRQSAAAQTAVANQSPGAPLTDYAHSVVLDALLWLGLPLGVLLLVLCAWWLLRCIARARSADTVVLLAMTIPFFVQSMAEFPYAYAFFVIPVGWLLGYVHASQSPQDFALKAPATRWRRSLQCALVLIFALLCGDVTREYFLAEEDFRVLRFEMRNLGSRPPDYAAPQLPLLTQFGALLQLGRLRATPGMAAADLERLRVFTATRHWARVHIQYVLALALNGQLPQARQELAHFQALYGTQYLSAARADLRQLRDTRYPQLSPLLEP